MREERYSDPVVDASYIYRRARGRTMTVDELRKSGIVTMDYCLR